MRAVARNAYAGQDVAGVVEQAGFDVEEYAPGDEVLDCVREDSVQHGACAW